ncbi:serine carboxypeptidase-like 7 isoform X2 [Oryza brachyantha]|uniref:serine carboxypeptidase-like 7 isoform X2 n=1 Tax=Oryza brachyantha TaxID=4533 RepID=UPI00077644CB|nr:serine carboxypeptidase-like 7 isoform X2 [Oryza brachyantha]
MATRLAVAAVLLCFCAVSAAGCLTRTKVTSLPGFDGALPSRIETGYVTVDEENGAELFYYFIESEGDPGTDPVLLWLTGGDRCSVLSAIFFEIGPLKVVIEPYNGELPRLRYHPYTWTKVASILFVDSPVGAGFSYSRDPSGYDVGEVSASLQLVKLLREWFSEHPEFLSNPFYVGGDSGGGKIVPFIAQKISEDIEAGVRPTLNLKLLDEISKAYILGRECIYVSPIRYHETLDRKMLEKEHGVLKHPPAQPSIECGVYANYLSYFWANSNVTRNTLGIKKGTVNEWVRCHENDLPYAIDIKSSTKYHRSVTLKGYRALVYSGDHDAIIPFLGTQAWVRSLDYPIVDDWRAWHVDGQSAGFTIAYENNMTFTTVKGAGHTAPEYEPERCFAMFSRWISNVPL